MSKDKATGLGTFDPLFSKSVPHILEDIFASLDYDSFMACRNVCKVWNELLSVQSYQQIAEKLLKEKEEGEEELCEASSMGNLYQVEHLIRDGIKVNCNRPGKKVNRWEGTLGGTPLYYAAMNGHKNVVKLLLNKGADPNKANMGGESPLLYAAQNRHIDVAKLLIEGGADPNKTSECGKTPLFHAAKNEYKEMVEVLLDAGSDPNMAEDNYGSIPLHMAAMKGRKRVAKLLLERGSEVNGFGGRLRITPLTLAAKNNQIEVAKLLLASGADPNIADNTDRTPLGWATYHGYKDMVKLLLDQ